MLEWIRQKKTDRMRVSVEQALLNQACASLRDGSRFQFRVEAIGGEQKIRPFLVKLSSLLGDNVWANCGHGLVTVYGNDTDSAHVVVATIKGA